MKYKNYDEFCKAIKGCGFKTKEAEYANSTKPPMVVHLRDTDNYISADCEQIYVSTIVIVELYTEKDNFADERKLEKWFRDNGIYFLKSEREYISSERWYVTRYEIEIELDEPEDEA